MSKMILNKTPLVQFMFRVNKTISVALEKTTEMALDKTVFDTSARNRSVI